MENRDFASTFYVGGFIVVLERTAPQKFLASIVKSHIPQMAEYGQNKKVVSKGEEDCLKISAYILPFSGAFLKFFL